MNMLLFLLILSSSFIAHHSSHASAPPHFRGLSPQDQIYYRSKAVFQCRDGSKKFSSAQLNDDYCDCSDSTDEPGTSACPNGKFYCHNAGHIPTSVFSSRVNDGICDCCDGSDEYNGKVICVNTCWEAGRVARDKLKKKIETYKDGLILRKEIIEQAKLAFSKDEQELSKRKSEEKILKGIVQRLKDRKAQIEKTEEEERLQREKEKIIEEGLKTTKEQLQNETGVEKVDGNSEDVQQNDILPQNEIKNLEDSLPSQDNIEDITGEDQEHLVDSRLTGENSKGSRDTHEVDHDDSHNKDVRVSKDEYDDRDIEETVSNEEHDNNKDEAESNEENDNHNKDQTRFNEEEDDDDKSDIDDDLNNNGEEIEDGIDNIIDADEDFSSTTPNSDDDYDLDHYSDIIKPENRTWIEKIQQVVHNILMAVKLVDTPVNKSDAAHIRDEYDKSNAILTKLQSRISSLTRKQKNDYGFHMELYSFYDQCFEKKQNNYVYKICPFKEASQTEGHRSTRLGRWEKFDHSSLIMQFSNGEGCWNGPDRTLTVKLRCGLKSEIVDVDEPSRCEYVALFLSPVGCTEEKLKELEEKNKRIGVRVEETPKGDEL